MKALIFILLMTSCATVFKPKSQRTEFTIIRTVEDKETIKRYHGTPIKWENLNDP